MNILHCRFLQRAVAAVVSAALVISGLAGCATKPAGYAWIAGVVVDGQRVARPNEGGLMSVTRDGKTVEGRAGMELRRGDYVVTGQRAEAVIRYATGSEILMRPNSGGEIGSFLRMFNEVFAKIRGAFEVETTFVRAGAQGTAFLVRTEPGGETSVIVIEGTVRVDSTQRAWAPVTLTAGQMGTAYPQAPQPMPASEAELQSTREWVERLERLVPQQAGISSTEAAIAAGAAAIAIGAILASRKRDRDSAPPPTTPPAGTDRAPTDRATPSQGGVYQPPAPEAAPPLGTPTGLRPGQNRPGGARLDCRSAITLSWSRVAGARDYVVRLEKADKPGQWRSGLSTATAGVRTSAAPSQLGSSNRWSVQARDGNRTGPTSPWVYFDCDFVVLR